MNNNEKHSSFSVIEANPEIWKKKYPQFVLEMIKKNDQKAIDEACKNLKQVVLEFLYRLPFNKKELVIFCRVLKAGVSNKIEHFKRIALKRIPEAEFKVKYPAFNEIKLSNDQVIKFLDAIGNYYSSTIEIEEKLTLQISWITSQIGKVDDKKIKEIKSLCKQETKLIDSWQKEEEATTTELSLVYSELNQEDQTKLIPAIKKAKDGFKQNILDFQLNSTVIKNLFESRKTK